MDFCGGVWKINIFTHTPPVQVDPGWSSLGCYTFVAHDASKCCGMLTGLSVILSPPPHSAAQAIRVLVI